MKILSFSLIGTRESRENLIEANLRVHLQIVTLTLVTTQITETLLSRKPNGGSWRPWKLTWKNAKIWHNFNKQWLTITRLKIHRHLYYRPSSFKAHMHCKDCWQKCLWYVAVNIPTPIGIGFLGWCNINRIGSILCCLAQGGQGMDFHDVVPLTVLLTNFVNGNTALR